MVWRIAWVCVYLMKKYIGMRPSESRHDRLYECMCLSESCIVWRIAGICVCLSHRMKDWVCMHGYVSIWVMVWRKAGVCVCLSHGMKDCMGCVCLSHSMKDCMHGYVFIWVMVWTTICMGMCPSESWYKGLHGYVSVLPMLWRTICIGTWLCVYIKDWANMCLYENRCMYLCFKVCSHSRCPQNYDVMNLYVIYM